MTYKEAFEEVEKRNKEWQDWASAQIGTDDRVVIAQSTAELIKKEGAPMNMHVVKHVDYPWDMPVKYSDAIYLVPSNVLCASSDIVRKCAEKLPLEEAESDNWTVKSTYDDLDW